MFDLTSSKESTEEKRNFNVIFSSFLSNFFHKTKTYNFLILCPMYVYNVS